MQGWLFTLCSSVSSVVIAVQDKTIHRRGRRGNGGRRMNAGLVVTLCSSVSSVVIAVQAKPFTAEDAEVTEEDE
jgi:hypothetical protein